jgi:hypothetical protein
MPLILPYWFPQRQAKAESVGPELYRLTGPNLPEAFIAIHQADTGRWSAGLRLAQDGPDVATTPAEFPTTTDAWSAAFELYRKEVIV